MTALWSPEGRPSEMRRFAERHGFDHDEDLLRDLGERLARIRPPSVVDRFAQVEPKVLIAVDGYERRGKWIDRRDEVAAIRAGHWRFPGRSVPVWSSRR